MSTFRHGLNAPDRYLALEANRRVHTLVAVANMHSHASPPLYNAVARDHAVAILSTNVK